MSALSSRLWLNLGLLALGAVLVAIVWFKPGKSPAPINYLLALDPAAISVIRIKREGRTEIRLAQRNSRWWLSAPIRVEASRARVNSLLGLATKASAARYAADELDLDQYGLSVPLATVYLDGAAIAFGTANPITNRRYLRIGDTVHLVADDGFDPITADLGAYVSNRLLAAEGRITELRLASLELSRANGQWHVSGAELSAEAAQQLIDAWQQASALWVGEQRVDAQQADIELTVDDGTRLAFAILAEQPELVLGRAELGLAYHFKQSTAERLLHPFRAGER